MFTNYLDGSIKVGKCVWLVTWGVFTSLMFVGTLRLNRALQVSEVLRFLPLVYPLSIRVALCGRLAPRRSDTLSLPLVGRTRMCNTWRVPRFHPHSASSHPPTIVSI